MSKHPTETFAAGHGTINQTYLGQRLDQPILQALMVALVMIMLQEFGDCSLK